MAKISPAFTQDNSQKMREAIKEYLEMVDGSIISDDFQFDFFESLKDQFESRGNLSDKQFASLEKIYQRVTEPDYGEPKWQRSR